MNFRERLKKPGYKILLIFALVATIATTPQWGRKLLRGLTFFHIHTVEIRGARYLEPSTVVSRLRVDTLWSIFDDLGPLEARLRRHPQIAAVTITRRPPGTLVVHITENVPVALVSHGDALMPYDSAGHPLPIDPSQTTLDLPILAAPNVGALQLLSGLRRTDRSLYDRISQVIAGQGGDLVFILPPALRIRAAAGVAPDRFHDIFPVESDLTRRNERPVELDIRFRDQVIARL
jgi:cell division protein FtsQ